MDSSLTDEDEGMAPLKARLTKKKEQRCNSKTMSINGKEDIRVTFEDKKIEQKRDLSVDESSTEPQSKKIKQDSCLDEEVTQSLNSPKSELDSASGVLSSIGNLCDSTVHQNHSHIHLKQKGKEATLGSGKMALTSLVESVQSADKLSVAGKTNDEVKSKNGILSHHKGPLLSMVNDSTKIGSQSDTNSLSDMNLPKESKLQNGTKRKVRESEKREQNAIGGEDLAFAVGKSNLKSTDGKQREINKDHTRKRAKESHDFDHSFREHNLEDANMSPPIRTSKGKQLVTKNGKIKSKRKGTHERDDHSSRDERDTDEAGSRKGLEGDDIIQNRSHGDESDGDKAASPIFTKCKYLSHSSDRSRANATKVSGRVSNESELSTRHSRRQSRRKFNLERKYPLSPKADEGRRSCIHSSHRYHSKRPHKHSKDSDSTSQGSHHREERSYHRDEEKHHRASKSEGRRMQNSESREDLSESSLSPSFNRGDEKPASSPRYNKFLVQSPKRAKNNLTSRDSGGENNSMMPSSVHKNHREHKNHKSQDNNILSPTEIVSPTSFPAGRAGERSSNSTVLTVNTQFKKSHRSTRERDKRPSSELSNASLTISHHVTEGRKHSHGSRRNESGSFSQGVRSSCRFASGTSEVSLVQDSSATSQNLRGYDMGGIGTPRLNSEEFYVHDITSPDIFSDEDNFIEEVDVVTSNSSKSQRRGSGRGNRPSVTELIDDDDSVILLDEETVRACTPPQADRRGREDSRSVDVYPDGGDITPRTAAAINQLEADEAMARRLQLEFDREEAYVRTPPEPEELGMTENFSPGEGQFARRMVHSYIPELYSSVITFGMGQRMMPWVESVVETRNSGRGGNHRGRGSRRRRHNIQIEHLYHQAEDDYERLLELEEQLGPAISQGLPPEILTQLPTFKFQEDSKSKAKEDEKSCTICMADYQVNEDLRRLPCFHAYHRDCIDRWFQNNSACPICRVRVEVG